MANKAYKFRIYPTSEQKTMFAKTFGCTRFLYNYYLSKRITAYETDKTSLSYNDCANDLTLLKKNNEYGFLTEVDSIALQQSLRHLDTAFQNFFKLPKTGYPKYKSKKHNRNSYTTICINGNISIEDGVLKLPKVGFIKVKQHRDIPDGYTLKSVTVS